MTQYFSIFGVHVAGLIGLSEAPLPTPLVNSNHFGDAAIMPLLPIISPHHDPYVPPEVVKGLKGSRNSPHPAREQAVSPPFDLSTLGGERNYTAWQEDGLSIGAIQFNETEIAGPSINNQSFNPAVVQWCLEPGVVGWFSVSQTSAT